MKAFPDIPLSPDSGKLSLNNISGMDLPFDERTLLELMTIVENGEEIQFRQIEAVYVDENEILQINKEYLDHDFVTDIITFRYDEENNQAIEATLYCCAPRIEEQSKEFETEVKAEYLRVFVHGLVHLAGYMDETEKEKKTMTALENRYLEQLNAAL